MKPGGGTSGVERVDVDMDSSELSVSIASNTTLPHVRLPMPKELSMRMREEEGRRQES